MEAEDAVRLERRCSIGNGGGVPRAADNGLCYEKMNLNGAEIDFKRCRDSLLKHAEAVKHDWAKKPHVLGVCQRAEARWFSAGEALVGVVLFFGLESFGYRFGVCNVPGLQAAIRPSQRAAGTGNDEPYFVVP